MQSILVRSKNIAATEVYYNTICTALKKCSDVIFDGFEGEALPENKNALIVCGSCTEMVRLWFRGYRKIVTWYQGILPEESYLRHHSKARKVILGCIERFALKHSQLHIFVSEAMREFYESKYRLKVQDYYIMPCFNASFEAENVAKKDFSGRVFTYAGALSKWQCIEQTLDLYARIEKAADNTTKLLLLTPEKEKAAEMVAHHRIMNAEIRFVHYSELTQVLREVTYGFALREDNSINRVATPTKLANYVANGVIPIYSRCVQDFFTKSRGNEYQVVIDDVNNISDESISEIVSWMQKPIDREKACGEFGSFFAEYYNPVWHVEQLANRLRKVQ